MSEQLTHWKKNNDSRYISGEDLKHGESLGKGLKPEMVVTIEKFEDSETFDQNENKKVMKTGFWLKDVETGKELYKPVILNNTNAEFFVKEFQSDFMENWLNKPVVLWAKPDKRHGFVARFKKHYKKNTASPLKAVSALNKSKSLEDLQKNWKALSRDEQLLPAVIQKKDELKKELSK